MKARCRKILIHDRVFDVDMDILIDHSPYFAALFGQNFKEAAEDHIYLKEVDADSFQLILEYCRKTNIDLNHLPIDDVMELTRTSNKLLFENLTKQCEMHFIENLASDDKVLDILKVSSDLDLNTLKEKCLKKIDNVFQHLTISRLSLLDEDLLQEVITSCSPQTLQLSGRVVEVVEEWSKIWKSDPSHILQNIKNRQLTWLCRLRKQFTNQPELFSKEKENITMVLNMIEQLKSLQVENLTDITRLKDILKFDVGRLELLPSILLCLSVPGNNSSTRRRNRNLPNDVYCATFSPFTKEVENEFELTDLGLAGDHLPVYPSGCRVISLGSDFILSGGEYSFGRNCWNTDILRYCYADGRCTSIGKLSQPIRHHTAVIIKDDLYLLGGFNKTRVMLNSMVKINLTTGHETECAQLPRPAFKTAAVEWRGKIVMIEGGEVCLYDPCLDSWTKIYLAKKDLPESIEFHAAMKLCDSILLTSTYSRDIYRLEVVNASSAEIKKLAEFKREAQNPCILGEEIYNFSMDEFSDERTVEVLNCTTGKSEILWKVENPLLNFASVCIMSAFPVHR